MSWSCTYILLWYEESFITSLKMESYGILPITKEGSLSLSHALHSYFFLSSPMKSKGLVSFFSNGDTLTFMCLSSRASAHTHIMSYTCYVVPRLSCLTNKTMSLSAPRWHLTTKYKVLDLFYDPFFP